VSGTRPVVLVVQPIHAAGTARLQAAGFEVRLASAAAMAVVADEIGDAVAVITRSAGLDRGALDAAPRLRVVGNHGVGLDPVDVTHATSLGIPVVNTPGANAVSVAELTVTLTLALRKRLASAERAARAGDFGFKYAADIRELSGATVGIVGFGEIGRRAAAMFVHGFAARLLVHAPRADRASIAAVDGESVTLERLLTESEVVSLHVPLTSATRHLLDAAAFARMRGDAILVNTARGELVSEVALIEALTTGRIAGAGLDVFAEEPLPVDHPLSRLPNVVLTPHVGGASREAGERTALAVAEQVLDVLADVMPAHLVNREVWQRRRR
jgi:D-3-phosphoglycerate dehydrogenase / 2-oxoglutarate reductase